MKPQIMGGLHPLEFQEMDLNLIPQVNVLLFFLKLSKFTTDMMVKLQVEIFVLHTLLLSKVCFLYSWIVQICCRSSCLKGDLSTNILISCQELGTFIIIL